LEAATGVFARLGYAGASMRDLAGAAGMEKGHLSYYFRTKEMLLFEIIDDLHSEGLIKIEEWTKADPTYDNLLELLRGHIDTVLSSIDQARVAYENFRFLGTSRRSIIVTKRRRYEDLLVDYVDSCRLNVGIDPDVPTRILVMSALGIMNWPYQWVTTRTPKAMAELTDQLALRTMASLQPVVVPKRRYARFPLAAGAAVPIGGFDELL
jgi:TetR/AcrR family transcriptional regulator, cholesterol catabolism regulator